MRSNRIRIMYKAFIIILGLFTLAANLYTLPIAYIGGILFLGIVAAGAESLSVSMSDKYISVSSAITLCAMITYGIQATVIVSAISILLSIIKIGRNKYIHLLNYPLDKTLFNLSNFSISHYVAGIIYYNLGGITLTSVSRNYTISFGEVMQIISTQAIYVIAFILINILLNTFIVSAFFYIGDRSIRFFQQWLKDFLWSFLSMFIIGLIGVLISAVYMSFGWFALLVFFSPLLLARYSFSLYSSLQNSYKDTIKALSEAIETKDSYTSGHSQRVMEYSSMIADELGFSAKRKEILMLASLLHDIGKIGVTESVLNKPEKLNRDEFDMIKQHPVLGAKIASKVDHLAPCVNMIKYHHKYYDGSGYPECPPDENIPLEAYIIATADAFDAMTSERPYRSPLSQQYAMSELENLSGIQFEPRCAKALLTCLQRKIAKEIA